MRLLMIIAFAGALYFAMSSFGKFNPYPNQVMIQKLIPIKEAKAKGYIK